MSPKLALVTVILAISLATSYSAVPIQNGTSAVTPLPVRVNTPYFRVNTPYFRFPNQRYFVFNNRQVTFFEAWHQCASIGLRLASVNSAEDDTALRLALRAADSNEVGPWWIAGTDLGKTGHFVWITTMKPLGYRTGYTNFGPGQPDNAGGVEHCVEAGWRSGTTWNDRNCEVRNRYVCETYTSEYC
ncbi:salivary C-type lectin [Culex quinquefasciatus]|uniref:Salivary C-type lectin n=1 Tax=Culex quinquefasciatus TaxID=7176 RepID=B0WID7_CULQU|nr:salivary C-type lectin [Culex quinquefasciatus]|eukprot:XP_001848471.1 salivary C-type lectin [Culex quinquefasciatus]